MSTSSYLADRIRREPPENAPVVPGTLPVISFGNVASARVASLGLNPSVREFKDAAGTWLTGSAQRLPTYDSLGIEGPDELTEEIVGTVIDRCYGYFSGNPYWQWFRPLGDMVTAVTGSRYEDGSACHLDLVQWATDPVWGGIDDAAVQRGLIEEDREFLVQQLRWEGIRVVIMNGSGVMDAVRRLDVTLEHAATLDEGIGCKVYVGEGYGARFVGWSQNVQNPWRSMTPQLKALVVDRARELVGDALAVHVSDSESEWMPQGLRLEGEEQLLTALERWLASSRAETVGDVGAFGGKAWISCQLAGLEVVLNADTRRSAVRELLSRDRAGATWRVVANRRGRINRIQVGEEPLPGLYCYTTSPLESSRVL